ncbi:bestrophin family ion channel [Herbaspirillum sp.]|uniref:bestrophin family protein n=1 Tax=Herbaspirillum sp. TaxID=1890675 RepID=UPI0031CE52FA
MIVRPPQSWLRLLFVWNGSVLQSILPQLLFIGVVSCVAVLTHGRIFGEKIPLNTTLLTLFGLTLAIFLGFRNTASYDRFKEARYLWGNLLIASRQITSQMLCYIPRRELVQELAQLIFAVVYALKHELRHTDPTEDLRRFLGPDACGKLAGKVYKPSDLLHELRARLVKLNREGQVSDVQFWTLDTQLAEMGKAVGGCERIAYTPIPFAYSVLLHRTVYTYCILLPFGLVDATELFTPLLCLFLAYTLIALEAIAGEVAEPFGLAPNALALDAMARNIERSICELCELPLPEPVKPHLPYQLT